MKNHGEWLRSVCPKAGCNSRFRAVMVGFDEAVNGRLKIGRFDVLLTEKTS